MRTFKLLFFGLILAVIGLFIWQNLSVFKTTLPFTFDVYFREQLAWTHSLYAVLLFVGALGLLLGVILMLKPYFGVRRLLAQERQQRQPATAMVTQPASATAEKIEDQADAPNS
jgi:uncharacterized membrane protein YcjF (UPF0283 family)